MGNGRSLRKPSHSACATPADASHARVASVRQHINLRPRRAILASQTLFQIPFGPQWKTRPLADLAPGNGPFSRLNRDGWGAYTEHSNPATGNEVPHVLPALQITRL